MRALAIWPGTPSYGQGVTRLGFAVMLKFYEIEGRFPAYPQEVPPAAVSYLGSLVKVDPALFAKYSWTGRSIKYHRSQIRKVYGTRPPTEDDEDRWAHWLAAEWCPAETNRDGWRPRRSMPRPPAGRRQKGASTPAARGSYPLLNAFTSEVASVISSGATCGQWR